MVLLRIIFFPLALLGAMIVYGRNRLYDWGAFTSKKSPIKTVAIGNLELGGTGKTPHAIALLQLLKDQFNLAFLSRGYGRKSKGFAWFDENSTVERIGDEPFLIHSRFPQLIGAVDESRVRGLQNLHETYPKLNLALLDDAFQHRKLKADCYILITTFDRPFFSDYFFPLGRLRDNRKEARRASIVIVSKCPSHMDELTREHFKVEISKYTSAPIFFTGIRYKNLRQVSGAFTEINDQSHIVAISGIAHPKPFVDHLRISFPHLHAFNYKDHESYTQENLSEVIDHLKRNEKSNPIIITTEKDEFKLKGIGSLQSYPIFVQPLEIDFLDNKQGDFVNLLQKFLNENEYNTK